VFLSERVPGSKRTVEEFYTTAGYVRALVDHLRALELPLETVLGVLGVRDSDLRDDELRVPHANFAAAFDRAEQLSSDPNIGLHVGQRMRLSQLGIVGHLLMTCGRIDEVFQMHARYGALVGGAPRLETESEQTLRLHWTRDASVARSRHLAEFVVSGWVALWRWLLGRHFAPVEIEFAHGPPADAQELRAYFACAISFDAAAPCVRLPAQCRSLPLLHGDATLRPTLEAEARKRLRTLSLQRAGADPLTVDVFSQVSAAIAHGVPELNAVAAALDVSVRSLQRRLDAQGTSYKRLVELVRTQLAERYARDPALSLADIALMLGFSEQSVFQRAFKRWFQTTPGEYRKALLRGADAAPS
jgi:AraC-like DNA-binding protein